MAEMQHYGAPTRLLDWTKSFYVAAFFAFEVERNANSAAIWAIDLAWLKARALAKIKKADAGYMGLTTRCDFTSSSLGIIDNVLLANKEPLVMPVTTFELNERLGIQQGLFLCPGNIRIPFEDNLRELNRAELAKKCLKFILPYRRRAEILEHLRRVNISAATLYPGLEGFSRSISNELFLLGHDSATFKKLKGGISGALNYL
jgi:hypothetical protein